MISKWLRFTLWLPLALVATLLYADARPALTVHETELRGGPAGNADSVATLPAESEITVFERKGGWYRVESGAGPGWLRLASLRFPGEMSQEADSGVDSLLTSMRAGSGAPVSAMQSNATTGVRGLDAYDIAEASPDEDELAKLEALASNADAGRQLAAGADLVPVTVAYLEKVAYEVPDTSGWTKQGGGSDSSRKTSAGDSKPADECYGDGCDPDIPFMGGD